MLKIKHTICPTCSVGCGLNIISKNKKIVGINSYKDHSINEGRNCNNCTDNINLFINNKIKQSTDYTSLIDNVTKILKDNKDVTILTSGKTDNVDLDRLMEFTKKHDYTLLAYENNFNKTDANIIASYDDISNANYIITIGDIYRENALIGRRIIHAKKNNCYTININKTKNLTGYNKEEGLIKRKIAGVSPGENIMLNGTIIGRVTSDNLEIIAQDNQIIKMIGGKIKKHGLEKLGKVDLTKAIVKTGLLRKTNNIKPRLMKHISSDKLTVVYLDHAAEDIYQYRNADLVVSVGDDTTLLSSDILYRFNVPIIGITDGDLDKVVLEGFKHDDSIIIQVESGYDDIIGEMIFKKVFSNKISRNVDDLVEFKKEILDTVDNSGISYKFVDKQLLD